MKTFKTYLMFAVCMLILTVMNEVIVYKLKCWVGGPYLRTATLMAMHVFGFALIGAVLLPFSKAIVQRWQSASEQHGGFLGVILFYALVFGALFFAYHTIITRGAQHLLPRVWR